MSALVTWCSRVKLLSVLVVSLERVCVGVVSVLALTATCENQLPPQAYVQLSVVCDGYVPKPYNVDGVSIPDLSLTSM